MSSKSEAQWLSFVLLCADCSDGKVDFKEVARRSGNYKSAKCAKQAFDGLKKKYPLPDSDAAKAGHHDTNAAVTANKSGPKKTKATANKRKAEEDVEPAPAIKRLVKSEEDAVEEGVAEKEDDAAEKEDVDEEDATEMEYQEDVPAPSAMEELD